MSYIYNLTDTWNAGGTTFTAVKMNVTDTASAAASLLMDLQVGGSSKFKVTKSGELYLGSWISMAVTTVASLPAAATAGAGARMLVSDALAPAFGNAVAGGGAVTVPVYSTGSAWNVG